MLVCLLWLPSFFFSLLPVCVVMDAALSEEKIKGPRGEKINKFLILGHNSHFISKYHPLAQFTFQYFIYIYKYIELVKWEELI